MVVVSFAAASASGPMTLTYESQVSRQRGETGSDGVLTAYNHMGTKHTNVQL